MLISDSNGNLLAVGVRRVQALWPPDISELMAAVFGIEMAIRLGYDYIHIEGGNVNVMKSITSNQKGCSPYLFSLIDYSTLSLL